MSRPLRLEFAGGLYPLKGSDPFNVLLKGSDPFNVSLMFFNVFTLMVSDPILAFSLTRSK